MLKFKFLFVVLAFGVFLMVSCEHADEKIIEESESMVQLRSSSNDTYVFYDHIGYFYNSLDTIIYFIQYDDVPLEISRGDIKIVEFNESSNFIKIRDLSNDTLHIYRLDGNIFGIGQYGGLNNINAIMDAGESGTFTFPPTMNEDQPILCGCLPVGDPVPSNCTGGGAGSTGCSVSDSGGAATFNWDHNCSASCASTHFSCCTTDNVFAY